MTYTFKVGDKGKTRGGGDYRVTAVGEKHILAVNEHGTERVYWADGALSSSGLSQSTHDLLPPKQRVEGFLNVYCWKFEVGAKRSPIGELYVSQEDADKNARKGRLACLEITREYEEGEGL